MVKINFKTSKNVSFIAIDIKFVKISYLIYLKTLFGKGVNKLL